MSSVPRPGQTSVPIEISKGTSGKESQIGIILTHGAGGNMSSGNLPAYAEALSAQAGLPCIRMTYNPRNVAAGQKCMQAVLDHRHDSAPAIKYWILAGQSMGGRVACEVALANVQKVIGLMFVSYPLHPPGKQDKLRDAPLQKLELPMLFVRGTRDPFCDTDKFEATLPTIPSKAVEVHTVEGGDHSLSVKGGKKPTAAALEKIIEAAMDFVRRIAEQKGSADASEETIGSDAAPPKKRPKRR